MIGWITGSLTLALLFAVLAIVQLGFFITFSIVLIGFAVAIGVVVALVTACRGIFSQHKREGF